MQHGVAWSGHGSSNGDASPEAGPPGPPDGDPPAGRRFVVDEFEQAGMSPDGVRTLAAHAHVSRPLCAVWHAAQVVNVRAHLPERH